MSPMLAMAILLSLVTAVAAQTQNWTQVGNDVLGGHDESASARSIDISADGSRMIVGEPHYYTADDDFAGRIRIFDLVDGAWVQVGQDLTGDAPYDKLGTSVAISADGIRVAAGGLQHGPIDRAGFARVFELVDETWVQVGQDFVGESLEDEFGASISLNGDGSMVAVGAPQNVGLVQNAGGHVRVFVLADNSWLQLGGDIDGHGGQGHSVALDSSGLKLVTGSPGYDGHGPSRGYVRNFEFFDGAWVQRGQIILGEAEGDLLGGNVDISADGSTVVAGSTLNDGAGERAGHVRVFRLFGPNWFQLGSDIDGRSDNEWFGYDVSISADGSRVAVGIRITSRNDSGHARVYDLGETGWVQVGDDVSNNDAGDVRGEAVALSADGNELAIGSSTGRDTGRARVFTMPRPVIMCGGLEATIVGTSGNDWLEGTEGVDVIAGLQGDDMITGLGGDDILCGGFGNDVIYGGQGFDIIYGAQGNDVIFSADGETPALRNDVRGMRAFGGAGDDTMYGSSRWDRMQGGSGHDLLYGFEGRDWMRGGAQSDIIDGGPDIDDLHGGNGNDTITVTARDTVRGGAGAQDICNVFGAPSRMVSCELRR